MIDRFREAFRFKFLVIVLSIGFFVAGCGGGGGGGGSSQAVVDADNAYDLATNAFEAALTMAWLDSFVVLMFDEVFVDEEGGVAGSCGGNLAYSGSYNENTGAFSGTITFNDFCDDDFLGLETVIDGSISSAGFFDTDTGELKTYTTKFNSFSVDDGEDDDTLNATMSVDLDSFPSTLDVSGSLTDNIAGKTYRLTNMLLGAWEGAGFMDIAMTGRYDDPDYGYVAVSTETVLRIYVGDMDPSSGVLIVTGDTGIGGGATRARLTALNNTAFLVEADTDGDGQYDDYSSGAVSWDEI